MGISNSCAKFNFSCFGWKKNKVFRRNKRDFTESIVRLRDDGVDVLPTARIIPNRNHTWDYVFTRSEGKGNLQPAVTQSLELVSIPSEFVNRPTYGQMEGHNLNMELINSLPPPIPPRKIELNVCSTALPIGNEQISSNMAERPSTEKSTSEGETCLQGNEAGKYDKTQEISTNMFLHSEDTVNWAPPKLPPRTFEIVTDGKAKVAVGTMKSDSDLPSVPLIPPRHL